MLGERYKIIMFVTASLAYLSSSCTQTVSVPIDKGILFDSRDDRVRVVSTGGDVYTVSRLSITDSTVVIEALEDEAGHRFVLDEAIVLHHDEVESIDRPSFDVSSPWPPWWLHPAILLVVVSFAVSGSE